ncbi:MAG: putative bifunctional diguanylate cyclase/phosphodiesterase [Ilumatobacter sp.]
MTPLLDELPDPVFAIGLDGTLRYVNQQVVDVLGWERDEVVGQPVLDLVHPDDLNIALASIATVGDKPIGDIITLRIRTGCGAWHQLELRGSMQDFDGERAAVVIARSTADRHRFALDQGEVATLRAVMSNMSSLVAMIEPDGRIRSVNDAVTRMLGHDPEFLPGRNMADLIHPDDRDVVFAAASSLDAVESVHLDARFLHDDGRWVTCEFTVKNLSDDPVVGAYIVSGEVAASLSAARERADYLAGHDQRTGLRNRDGFLRDARALLAVNSGLGVLIVDITRFRSINELYGDQVGDAVLAIVAERLDAIHWPELITAHFGGGEFLLAVRSTGSATIEMLRRRVERDLTTPVWIGDLEVRLSVRTATVFGADSPQLEPLLATVSSGLQRAKHSQRSVQLDLDTVAQRRAEVEALHDAITDGQIQPFFQPIVTSDGTVVAAETLVRWVHPERGTLDAGSFLPLARMAGLADAIDELVLEGALGLTLRLGEMAIDQIEVHLNADPQSVGRDDYAQRFLELCDDQGVDPARFVVEITENDLLAPDAPTLASLNALRAAGTRVAIDDFGTGYSSLAHLLELPVDGLKIDRRFVAGMGRDAKAADLTRAIVALSSNLGLDCVAEGVEETVQRDWLTSVGCERLQGWLFARAMPGDEFLAMLPRVEVPAEASMA